MSISFAAWNKEYEPIPTKEEHLFKASQHVYTDSLTTKEKQSKVREVIRTGSLLIMGLLALGVMLVYLRFILVPLIFSRFLVYIFQPITRLATGHLPIPLLNFRLNLPRFVGVLVVLLLIFGVLAALGAIISITIQDVIANADSYVNRMSVLSDSFVKFAQSLGYTKEEVIALLPDIQVSYYALLVLEYLLDTIPELLMILLIVVYMLLGYEEEDNDEKSELSVALDFQIRTYVVIHTLLSVVLGVLTTIVLLCFSVDFSLFFGLMTFVLNYIPNVGSIVAIALPLPFVLLDDRAWWRAIIVGAILILFQFLICQVLEPKILGKAMNIPPVTVIVALLFWGAVWGIIGAILSVPLTVAIKLYLSNIDHPAPQALSNIIVGDFGMFDTSRADNPLASPTMLKNSDRKSVV